MEQMPPVELMTEIELHNRKSAELTPAAFWMRASEEISALPTDDPAVLFVSIPELPVIDTEAQAIDIQSLGHPLLATAVAAPDTPARAQPRRASDSQTTASFDREFLVENFDAPLVGGSDHVHEETLVASGATSITPNAQAVAASQPTTDHRPQATAKTSSGVDLADRASASEPAVRMPATFSQWSLANRQVDLASLDLNTLQSSRSTFDSFQRFADAPSQTLLFCDAEDARVAEAACVAATRDLAQRFQQPVLLIDAQLDQPGISDWLGVETNEGWAEVIKLEKQWQSAVYPSDSPLIYFMPPGVVKLRVQAAGNFFAPRMHRLCQELSEVFRFVVVSTGTCFDSGLQTWAKFCDQAYLTADPVTSSRSLTKAAMEHLRDSHARVSGVVVIQQPQIIN